MLDGGSIETNGQQSTVDRLAQLFTLLVIFTSPLITARFQLYPDCIPSLKQLALVFFSGLWFLTVSFRSVPELRDGRLFVVVLALPIIEGLASATSSFGFSGAEHLIRTTTYLLIFLSAAGTKYITSSITRAPRYLLIPLFILSAYVLLQFGLDDPLLATGTDSTHRAGTMSNQASLHGLLILGLPFSIWLTRDGEHLPVRIVAALTSVAMLLIFLLHRNPHALAALAGGGCTGLILYSFNRSTTEDQNTSFDARHIGSIAQWSLLLFGGAVFLGLFMFPRGLERSAKWLGAGDTNQKHRVVAWTLAGTTARQSFPLGAGAGNFSRASKPYQSSVLKRDAFRTVQSPPEHAGNQYLTSLVETGAVGLLTLLILFSLALRVGVVRAFGSSGTSSRFAFAFIASALGIALYSFVYDTFQNPVTGGLFFLFLGLSTSTGSSSEHGEATSEGSLDWPIRLAGGLLVLGLIFFQLRFTWSRYAFERGMQVIKQIQAGQKRSQTNAAADGKQALRHLRRAITLDPNLIEARVQLLKLYDQGVLTRILGSVEARKTWNQNVHELEQRQPYEERLYLYRAKQAHDTYRRSRRPSDFREAVRLYRKSVKLNPNLVDAYRNLAWLMQNRNPQKTLSYFREARRIIPADRELRRNTITLEIKLLEENERYERALQRLKDVRDKYPDDPVLQTFTRQYLQKLRQQTNGGNETK